jgi:hypothetical protein
LQTEGVGMAPAWAEDESAKSRNNQ